MKTVDAIEAAARPGAAFSNGTEFEIWSSRWCAGCRNDADQDSGGCPILLVALLGEVTPAEWEKHRPTERGAALGGRYRCTEFTSLEGP